MANSTSLPIGVRFHRVATLDELRDGAQLEVFICGWNILICLHENLIYAVENRCSHQDMKLTGARMRKGKIICPIHGAHFDLATGAACSKPATCPIATFPVRVTEQIVEVAIPVIPGDIS